MQRTTATASKQHLWAAYRNQEHRMKQWITLLSIANTRCDTKSGKASREVEQLKKQVAQLQKARSRSPRGGQRVQEKVLEVIPIYKILLRRRRIQEKEDEPKAKKATKVVAENEKINIQVLLPISSTKLGTRFSTSTTRRILDSCFPFQCGSCSKPNCKQHHNCAGCDKVGVAYKDCLCLAHL